MSDIISEISRISEDELRMQIALIDNVNISNAVKETGYLSLIHISEPTRH